MTHEDTYLTGATQAVKRVKQFVEIDRNGCWIWQRSLTEFGYGQMRVGDRMQRTHRITYEAFVGPLVGGMHIDHLCRVRACCNPAHLEQVSPRVNCLRGETIAAKNSNKTECVHGHPLTGENVYLRPDRPGRNCRQCKAEANLRHRARSRS